jgi:ketosteroid isomerase-like protein
MRQWLAVSALASLLSAPIAAAQSPQSAIAPMMDELMAAANAHDTDRYLAPFLHDSSLVFIVNTLVINGYPTLHDLQWKAWNSPKTDATYSRRAPDRYEVLTPTLVLSTSLLGSSRTAPTGETKKTEMVVTMLWQLRSDGWRIVQTHESTAPVTN